MKKAGINRKDSEKYNSGLHQHHTHHNKIEGSKFQEHPSKTNNLEQAQNKKTAESFHNSHKNMQHDKHKMHDKHKGHSVDDFKKRFVISLLITIPVLLLSQW